MEVLPGRRLELMEVEGPGGLWVTGSDSGETNLLGCFHQDGANSSQLERAARRWPSTTLAPPCSAPGCPQVPQVSHTYQKQTAHTGTVWVEEAGAFSSVW